jgi:hypothetical protein
MRLKRPDRSKSWRIAVFIAVVGLHVLAGLLLFAPGTVRIERMRAAAPLSLLWLSRENRFRPPVTPAASTPEQSLKKRAASPDIEPPPDAAVAEASNAITLPLELSSEADAAARRQSDQEGNERRWRNLAGPSDSQLEWSRNNVPLVRDRHQRNDIEHAEGGEIITWMNDKCFYTNHGITTFGLPQTGMVCKDPPKPETDLFKDMRKKLDESAKGRAP